MTRTDADIKAAAKEWCLNPVLALAKYGHISCWNVSPVTDMTKLFYNQRNFNDDISRWEVANVKNMSCMFNHAVKFNQNVSSWKVANVKDMGSMFDCARSFNQDLSDWAVSAGTKTWGMFHYTRSLDPKPRWYKEPRAQRTHGASVRVLSAVQQEDQ